MNLDIFDSIRRYTPNTTGVNRNSSVLIPIILIDNQWHILYEVRSNFLSSQPGEICFPGGKIEENESPQTAAIRETCEELNLDSQTIEIIGHIDSVLTNFDMIIHCFVAIIKNDFELISPSQDEVDHLFAVPIDYLISHVPEEYELESKFTLSEHFPYENIPNGKDYNFRISSYPIIFYQYKNYNIWGLTARMTKNFIEVMKNSPNML